jgi:hypothetical protein
MRHSLKFDGLQVLDVGRSVPRISIDHQQFGTPAELGGSVIDFLVRYHARMRSAALDWMLRQHALLFPYEDGNEARDRLELLLSEQTAAEVTDGGVLPEPWQIGDALRLELVVKAAELQITPHTPTALTEFAVTEMIRNGYRRLHILERPVVESFFNVFMQVTQPTQLPLEVLAKSAIERKRLTPAEAKAVMKENSTYFKAQLQALGNLFLMAVCTDPMLMTLQNAALYQQLKRFFEDEGEE